MQVINIIHGQLLLAKKIERRFAAIWSATDKRGEHTAMVSNR